MVAMNALKRTFWLKDGNNIGTGFVIDVDDKQYLVTAAHVCSQAVKSGHLEIWHQNVWKNVPIRVAVYGDPNSDDQDVAALVLHKRIIAKDSPIVADGKGVYLGQTVYFLGFPYGLSSAIEQKDGYPLPLIKAAVLSGNARGNKEYFLLDGMNNKGFSGGPVVFAHDNNMNDFRIMGVVRGYRSEELSISAGGQPTPLAALANSGIMICATIETVVDMIRTNPIGII